MNTRIKSAVNFSLSRMGEASTWQGIGFIAALFGAKWAANLDWGSAAALGGTVSAFIKAVFPDKLGAGDA